MICSCKMSVPSVRVLSWFLSPPPSLSFYVSSISVLSIIITPPSLPLLAFSFSSSISPPPLVLDCELRMDSIFSRYHYGDSMHPARAALCRSSLQCGFRDPSSSAASSVPAPLVQIVGVIALASGLALCPSSSIRATTHRGLEAATTDGATSYISSIHVRGV
jgi:hypothetical protein